LDCKLTRGPKVYCWVGRSIRRRRDRLHSLIRPLSRWLGCVESLAKYLEKKCVLQKYFTISKKPIFKGEIPFHPERHSG